MFLSRPTMIGEKDLDSKEKILELRKSYQLGPARITWYLERYYGIKTSQSTVTRTLVRNGVSRLPKTASRRTLHTKRYVKSTPGHHVQIDVKFAFFKDESGKTIKRYQFTAIDDATRIRALKIKEWEDFYNFNRPHKSHGGLTPYEIFRAKMNIDIQGQPKSEV